MSIPKKNILHFFTVYLSSMLGVMYKAQCRRVKSSEKNGFSEVKVIFADYLDMSASLAAGLFAGESKTERILDKLRDFIAELGNSLSGEKFEEISCGVWVAKSTVIESNVTLNPPCVIGEGTCLRCGVYIRGGVITGKDCIIGNSSEVKDSILFDGVKLPHFNYVGDSVLGRGVHLGAGAVISNLKSTTGKIRIKEGGVVRMSERRKFGALVGDMTEIGASAVICPGSVVGRESIIYPLSLFRGELGHGIIYKNNGETVKISKR